MIAILNKLNDPKSLAGSQCVRDVFNSSIEDDTDKQSPTDCVIDRHNLLRKV